MGLKEKRLVESILFSAGKPLSINEISKTTNLSTEKIKTTLEELIQDYNVTRKNETTIGIVKAGDKFAMQIKKEFIGQSIMVTKPEIDNNLLKTLTLIAFHQPLKQSNLRRMIGTKAYEHVDQLTAMNLVNSKKHGATEMLTTTKFFPEYFGIDSTKPDEIRDFLMKKVISKIENQNNFD